MDKPDNPEQPDTAAVLAEVERRRTKTREMSAGERRAVILADRFAFYLSKHWLALFNVLALLYVGFPILAPALMHMGARVPATIIYSIYRPLCHQLPQRSWFLFGPQFAYTPPELMERTGIDVASDLARAATFIGNEAVGYKMALCQRCIAIHGAIFLFGLLYVLGRRRVRPLPWWAYIGLGILPMMLDGGYQLLSYVLSMLLPNSPIPPHETTPFMRTLTGGLFGLATVWLAYPLIQETMDEFREKLHQRFGW